MRTMHTDFDDFRVAAGALDARFPVEWAPWQHAALDLLGHPKAGLMSAGQRRRLWRLALGEAPTPRELRALEAVTLKLWGIAA